MVILTHRLNRVALMEITVQRLTVTIHFLLHFYKTIFSKFPENFLYGAFGTSKLCFGQFAPEKSDCTPPPLLTRTLKIDPPPLSGSRKENTPSE